MVSRDLYLICWWCTLLYVFKIFVTHVVFFNLYFVCNRLRQIYSQSLSVLTRDQNLRTYSETYPHPSPTVPYSVWRFYDLYTIKKYIHHQWSHTSETLLSDWTYEYIHVCIVYMKGSTFNKKSYFYVIYLPILINF